MDDNAMTVTSADIPGLLAAAERATLTASLIFDVVDGYASGLDPSATPVRPNGGLRFSLVEAAAGTKAGQPIEPPWPLRTIINPSGYRLWFGQRADGGPPPDPGSYALRIDSDLYVPYLSENPVQIPTPDAAVHCVLAPGYAYPFGGGGLAAPTSEPTLVRGTLQSYDGTGQAGATVILTAGADSARYLTDAGGQFALVVAKPVPPTVSLDIAHADGTTSKLTNIAVTVGATTTIPQTMLTGRVISTARGGSVQLNAPAVTVDVASDGTWRIVLPLDQTARTATVSASVPGQRKKSQSKVAITPGQIVTVPPFVFNP